jgi:hypothetical protein
MRDPQEPMVAVRVPPGLKLLGNGILEVDVLDVSDLSKMRRMAALVL